MTSLTAQIVADAKRWQRTYLRKAVVIFPSDTLIDITQRASQAGADFDCELAENAVKRLRSRDPTAQTAFRSSIKGC